MMKNIDHFLSGKGLVKKTVVPKFEIGFTLSGA